MTDSDPADELRRLYPPIMTTAHVAEMMHCTIGDVRDKVHRGELEALRWGQQFRFFREEVIASIASVVRSRMEHEGIKSVRGFADHVGMSWKPIDKLLHGDPNPPLSTLLQLAHALDLCSIEELLGPFETRRVLGVGRGTIREE